MATRKTYICNLCRDEYREAEKACEKLYGFEFEGPHAPVAIKPALQDVRFVENHICKRCMKGLLILAKAAGIKET